MASAVKYYCFVEDLAEKVHDLDSDTLKIALSNTTPDLTDTNLVSVSEISAGNGYTAGGNAVTITGGSQTTGTYTLTQSADVTFTAGPAAMATFRYAILYNATADRVICYWDYGSTVTLQNGETFTVNLDPTVLQLV